MQDVNQCLEELLLFTYNEIEINSFPIKTTTFNFHFEYTESYISNHPNELFPEGEDLSKFKETHEFDNETIKKALQKSLNEEYFKRQYINSVEFSGLTFTIKGNQKAKNIIRQKKEEKENKKQNRSKFFKDYIFPIILIFLTSIITTYINNQFQNNNLEKRLNNLEKEIKWLKKEK